MVSVAATFFVCVMLCVRSSVNARAVSHVPTPGLILPTDVAPYGRDGYVVADAVLQRIFVVASNGTTTVLAGGGEPNSLGSVPGGYANGKGDAARFNAPQGIVVDEQGNVYVADTGNHCIRKIAPGGEVSTLAGNPAREGSEDGPASTATFRIPRGIALDVNGDLLVADSLVGIRRVTRAGHVSTLPFPVNTAFDITVLAAPDRQTVYVVSDISGLLVAASNGVYGRYALDNVEVKNGRGTAGGTPIGHPFALTAYGSHRVVYTDRFTNAVRVIDIDSNYVRLVVPPLGGAPRVMSEPIGIHLRQDHNSVAIVDAGRRRLDVLQLDPDRTPFSPSAARAFPPPPDPSKKRIALIGNSMVWWATDWGTSIEGRTETLLNERPLARPVEVLPINSPAVTAAAQLSYAGELCEAHLVNVAAVNLNSGVLHDSYSFTGPISSPAALAVWAAPLRAAITPVVTACRSAGIPFMVVISPLSAEVSASEDGIRRLLSNDLVTDPGRTHRVTFARCRVSRRRPVARILRGRSGKRRRPPGALPHRRRPPLSGRPSSLCERVRRCTRAYRDGVLIPLPRKDKNVLQLDLGFKWNPSPAISAARTRRGSSWKSAATSGTGRSRSCAASDAVWYTSIRASPRIKSVRSTMRRTIAAKDSTARSITHVMTSTNTLTGYRRRLHQRRNLVGEIGQYPIARRTGPKDER